MLHLIKDGMPVKEIVDVLLNSYDGVEETLAIAFQLPVEEIQKFDIQTLLKAITAVVKVNTDFFVLIQADLKGLTTVLKEQSPSRSAKRS